MKTIPLTIGDGKSTIQLLNNSERHKIMGYQGARVFWLVDSKVARLHSKRVQSIVSSTATAGKPLNISVSERIKSNTILQKFYQECSQRGLTRADLIGVIGGGALSDFGGFLAATWMRGIPWVVVPTTLLAMVDAAIGGKTGINLDTGKNQIGAIWQPRQIVVDRTFLSSLPAAEFRSGMGEVVKYAGLLGSPLLQEVHRFVSIDGDARSVSLSPIIEKCLRFKVEIVQRDPREGNIRAVLNLGHTFGHGIEAALGYGRLRHGEAVLIGLAAANRLAVMTGKGKGSDLELFDELVIAASQKIRLPKFSVGEVLKRMKSDKKRTAAGLRFVLLRRPGEPNLIENVPTFMVQEALRTAIEDIKEGRTITS